MTNKILLLFLLLVSTSKAFSQKIENVDMRVENNIVIITYDLLGVPNKTLCNMSVTLISDNGEVIQSSIFSSALTGDIKDVGEGKGKIIKWDVLADGREIKGRYKASVAISSKRSTKIVGGPSNAFLSMLLPGLGNFYVDDESSQNWGYYVMGGFALAAYSSYSSYVSANNAYEEYHKATSQYAMDAAYEEAEKARQSSQLMLGLAGAIWLGDVIYVAAKGFKNRKQQLGYAHKPSTNNFYVVGAPNNFRIGFIKHF